MHDLRRLRSIGMMAARQARARAQAGDVSANEVISMTALLKEWAPEKHDAGEVTVYRDYPYKCIQSHDSSANPDWTPEAAPALFAPYHATAMEYALPWRAPTHAGDAYMAGEWMLWEDGTPYECRQDGCVYDPGVLPSAWRAADV